jgi:hypothetical protein
LHSSTTKKYYLVEYNEGTERGYSIVHYEIGYQVLHIQSRSQPYTPEQVEELTRGHGIVFFSLKEARLLVKSAKKFWLKCYAGIYTTKLEIRYNK